MVLHHRPIARRQTAARYAIAHEFRHRLGQILRDLRDDGAPLNELQRLSGLKRRELTALIQAIEVLESEEPRPCR